ncbi:hypothetical protein DUNSADRAFT_10964 [Dunaliella salina]|uniref:Uncharacterized protein n=1 Tax=Dunaliella salina TaxID=3046 RepID=A0ABQ7GEG7_DUNSA|nr:hypothetical protein DUNSADRAFT_10964 [Dunaliella salina]|eukprot:KAF5832977.1 hypothetical protein DUNSADRAFT_10964 [Dunaliella salina]
MAKRAHVASLSFLRGFGGDLFGEVFNPPTQHHLRLLIFMCVTEPKSSIKSGIQRTISRRHPATAAPAPPDWATPSGNRMPSTIKGDAGLEGNHGLAGSKSGAGSKLRSLLKGLLQVLRWLGTSTILTARRALLKATSYVEHVDAYMRLKLMDNLDALVSVALVVGLILGTLLLTAVLCVQIGIEGRRAVVAADRSVRRHSTAMATVAAAAVSSDDVDLLNATDPTDPAAQVLATGHPVMDGVITNVRQHKQGLMDTAVALQQHALKAVQIFLPTLQKHADSMASKFVERYNLTTVLRDMEKVYFSLPISINCTKDQLGSFSEEVAASALRLRPLEEAVDSLGQQVAANRTELKQVMEAWERKWMAMQATHEPNHESTTSSTDSEAGSGEASGVCKGSEAVPPLSPHGMGVNAKEEEETGTDTCAGTPLEMGGGNEENGSCRNKDGSESLRSKVVGGSAQGGSQQQGRDSQGACGLEGVAQGDQQQQQQQQQQEGSQEQGGGTSSTTRDAARLDFSDEEWEQGVAHARLLEVRRALAAARAAAKEAVASASDAQDDYKLAVRKLRGCHGLNSASDRNTGLAGGVAGGSGEFLDKLLGGGKGGAAQLGSLVRALEKGVQTCWS